MDEFLKKFGEKVKEYRELCGYSQERLAELCEVSTNTINSIENSKTFLTYQTLKNISTALNIQIPELFNFEVKAADENNRLLHQIIARAKNLTPAQQKQVIQILKTFE